MKNATYNTLDVRHKCENKLGIQFRMSGELNGWYYFKGKKVARITVPSGRKFIPPKTYKSMATQLKLQVEEFDDLLDCPLTKQRYDELLEERVLKS